MVCVLKVSDVKAARHLATEITLCGARVYDLLANEDIERYGISQAKASQGNAMQNRAGHL